MARKVNHIAVDAASWPESICLSPDGAHVAVGSAGGDIFFYLSTSKHPQTHLSVDDDPYDAVAVTVLAWTNLSWLSTGSQSHKRIDRGIVAGFQDGVIRAVSKRASSI